MALMVDHPSVETTPPYLLQCQGRSFFSTCFVKIIVVSFYIYLSAVYLLAFVFSACVCVGGTAIHLFTCSHLERYLGISDRIQEIQTCIYFHNFQFDCSC